MCYSSHIVLVFKARWLRFDFHSIHASSSNFKAQAQDILGRHQTGKLGSTEGINRNFSLFGSREETEECFFRFFSQLNFDHV